QFFETTDIRLGGLDGSCLQSEVRLLFGGFLFADTGGFQEISPTLGGDFCQRKRGFGLAEFSAGPGQLLVQVRRIDFGEKLAGLDLIADIDNVAFEITTGASVNRGFNKRPDFGGNCCARGGFARRGRNDTDDRSNKVLRFMKKNLMSAKPW